MANYADAIRIYPQNEISIAAADITASPTYAPVGTFLNPIRILYFLNSTSGQLNLSWDGVNRGMTIAAGAQGFIDISANEVCNKGAYMAQNITIWVTYDSSPTTGSLYITPFYGAQ